MGITVGELEVIFEAETREFDRRMDRVERRIDDFERKGTKATRNTSKGFAGLGTAIGAAGIALAVGALAAAADQALEFASGIDEAADRTGFTAERLQELRFAARETGVEQAALDRSLRTFSRNVAEAGRGVGTTVAVFERLGVSVRNTDGSLRSSESVLRDVSDAIQGAESDSDRTRIAFELFGAQGAQLVDTLRDGEAGLEGFARRAREAGQVVDERLIQSAEDLQRRIGQADTQIKTAFLPTLLDFKETTVLLREGVAGLAGSVGEFIDRLRALPDQQLATLENSVRRLERAREVLEERLAQPTTELGARQDRAELARVETRLEALRTEIRLRRQLEEGRQEEPDPETSGRGIPGELTDDQLREQIRRQRELRDRRARIEEELFGEQDRARKAARAAEREAARQAERERRARARAVRQIEVLEQRRTLELARQRDPLEAQRVELERQVEALRELARIAQDAEARASAARQIASLEADIVENQERQNTLAAANVGLQEVIAQRLAVIALEDRDRAAVLRDQVRQAVLDARGAEDLNRRLQEILREANEFALAESTTLGERISEGLAQGLTGNLFAALEGDAASFEELLLTSVEDATREGMEKAFQEATDGLQERLEKVFDGLSDRISGVFQEGGLLGGLGLGDALDPEAVNAAIGLGAAAFRAFRQGAESESSSAAQVRSAVTSTQQVRGIVAGPRQIAIAQVERGIAEALRGTEDELRRQTPILAEISQRVAQLVTQGGGGAPPAPAGGGSPAGAALALESESLV